MDNTPDPTSIAESTPGQDALLLTDVTPQPPSTAHKIFMGPLGLRAGWSMAIFISIFLTLVAIVSIAAAAATGQFKKSSAQHSAAASAGPKTAQPAKPVPPKEEKWRNTSINEGSLFAVAVAATFALALIERRRMGVYGINGARVWDFLPGALWGLVSLSLLVFVLHACHVLVFDAQLVSGTAAYLYGAKWLLVFLLVGLTEEYVSRGFLQYTLTRGLLGAGQAMSPLHARAVAFWLAAIVNSIIFGALHLGNAGETPSGIAMVFCAGLLFSYALWRTGSLWWAIGFHMSWDWAQSFLWGVPDSGQLSAGRLFQTHATGRVLLSGGSDGPEGSVLVLPTLLLVVFVIRFTTRQRAQPPLEPLPMPHPVYDSITKPEATA